MKKTAVSSILVLLAAAVITEAQPKKVTRIGYLSENDPASESIRAEAIRLALRELGYIEGQNIATEYRSAEGKLDRLPERPQAPVQAINGRCARCGHRLAWILVPGNPAYPLLLP